MSDFDQLIDKVREKHRASLDALFAYDQDNTDNDSQTEET
jgi:hypothetical protein